MQFETTRSPLGELVYQLKYRNGEVADIVETAVAFVTERWGGSIDCVVPLWETGSTLRRVAEVLGQMGASEIRALAMTRTK